MSRPGRTSIAEAAEGDRQRQRGSAVSVIVPVTQRPHDLAWLYRSYSKEFVAANRPYEFVFATEPWASSLTDPLQPLIDSGEPIRIVRVGQTVGESTLLDVAGSTCSNRILVTIPSYPRVEAGTLAPLIARVEGGADMASAVRTSQRSSVVNRIQNRIFHRLLKLAMGGNFRDVASGVWALKGSVLKDLPLYGDFFRFLPVLADREGFQVVEVEVEQHVEDQRARMYGPGIYLRRLIDLLGLMVLVRFTNKPLRFFGLVGSGSALGGGAILLMLFVQRVGGRGIADRPLLLLGTLLFVLGIQAVGMGLLGEIMVHLSASHRKLYRLRDDESAEGRL